MSSPVVPIRNSYDRVVGMNEKGLKVQLIFLKSIPSLDAICNPIIIGFVRAKISNRFKKSEWMEKYAVIGRRSLILYPDKKCIGKQKGAKLFELVKVERQELKIRQKFIHGKVISAGRKRCRIENVIIASFIDKTVVKLRLPDEDIAKKCATAMNSQADEAKEAKRKIEEELANESEFPSYGRQEEPEQLLKITWLIENDGFVDGNGGKSPVRTQSRRERAEYTDHKVPYVMEAIKAFQKEQELAIAYRNRPKTAQPQKPASDGGNREVCSSEESEDEESPSATSSSSTIYHDCASAISTLEQEESWWTKLRNSCLSAISFS